MLSGGQLKDPNSWFHATSPAAVAGYQLTVAVAFCIGIAAVSHDQPASSAAPTDGLQQLMQSEVIRAIDAEDSLC